MIRLDPQYASAWNGRCWNRALIGDLNTALGDCNESLRLKPNVANTLDSRALVYLKLGQLDEALADYDASLQISPRFSNSLYGRGVIKLKKGDRRRGRERYVGGAGDRPQNGREVVGLRGEVVASLRAAGNRCR